MKKKIPNEWALKLAELHNQVMELQDFFDTWKNNCYSHDLEHFEEEEIEGFELDDLEEDVEYICDKLDDLEAETSELDCEYNDYENESEEEDE